MDNSLTKGNIWLSIWTISWPMVIIMLGNFILGITDIYAAGKLGTEVQASVGFCMQILFFLTVFANAIGIGTLSLVSKAVGAGEDRRAVEIARQALFCGIIVSLLIISILFLFGQAIVSLAGFPSAIQDLSISLLQFYAFALGNNYIVIIANSLLRATGKAKQSMVVMIIMNAINIVLIFPLAFGIGPFSGFGAQGLAFALVLATLCGALLSLLQFKSQEWDGFYRGRIKLHRGDLISIVSIGWPSALMQIAWHSGTLMLMGILGRLEQGGVESLAALTNGLRIEAIIYLPAFALNMAASVLTGQNLGAGKVQRAEKTAWMITLAGIAIVSVISTAIFIAAPLIAAYVSMDAQVQKETTRYLYYNLPVEPFMALAVVLAGAMQGAGDTRGVMRIIIFCMWIIRIPLAWTMAVYWEWGSRGVWTAMILSMIIQGLLMALRFKGGKWKG